MKHVRGCSGHTLPSLSPAPNHPIWVVPGTTSARVWKQKRGSQESHGGRGSAYTLAYALQSFEKEAKREQGCSSKLLQQSREAGQSKTAENTTS